MFATRSPLNPVNRTTDAYPHPATGTSTAHRGLRFGLLLAGMVVIGAMTAPSALAAAEFPPGPTVTGDPAPTHDGIIVHDLGG